MSFILVLAFLVAWAPLQLLNTYRFFSDAMNNSDYFAEIFFICHLFAISSSYLNPLIYVLTNVRFRNGFKYFMTFCTFGDTKNVIDSYQESELQKLTTGNGTGSYGIKVSKRFDFV